LISFSSTDQYLGSDQTHQIDEEQNYQPIFKMVTGNETRPQNECPDDPINPSPYDGEIDVSTSTELCVYVSDPDTSYLTVSFYWCDGRLIETKYDVLSGSTICTSPLNLEELTEYCWFVEVSDGDCIVTGPSSGGRPNIPCWCFTTEEENDCPEEPINDHVGDGAVDVDVDTTLCVSVFDSDGQDLTVHFYWCDDTLIETVYDVPSGSQACTSPLSLEYDTTYYWYAKVSDGICENTSDCWEFTTKPRPCQDIVWVDDNFNQNTPGFDLTHFISKQLALDTLYLDVYGLAYMFDGIYYGDIIINEFPCDNTGITQMGEYGCFPSEESAKIVGSERISVNDVSILYMEYAPSTTGSIIIEPGVSGTFLKCNKFNKDCYSDAKGVVAKKGSSVQAEFNGGVLQMVRMVE
jgi:hypothetical protein